MDHLRASVTLAVMKAAVEAVMATLLTSVMFFMVEL